MVWIGKTFTFEAAHRLQNHNGKCRRLHGHSYRVDVAIEGEVQEDLSPRALYRADRKLNPQAGMVLDFSRLKEWWAKLEPKLDHMTILQDDDPLITFEGSHQGLRNSLTVVDFAPTAENLAAWIHQDLQTWLLSIWPNGFVTPRVRVWETQTSWAEA